MSAETLTAALERGNARLPGGDTAAARRSAALRAFNAAGLPTTRAESWRYTDLSRLDVAGFDWLPPVPDDEAVRRAGERLAAAELASTTRKAHARLVFVDGHYAASLSRTASSAAAEIGTLAERSSELVREKAGDRRATNGGRGEKPSDRPLVSLNTAFGADGAWVNLPAGRRLDGTVEIVFVGSGSAQLAPQPRIAIELGADAKLELVVRFVDCGAPGGWINLVTDVALGPNAKLDLLRIQEHGPDETHTELLRARLDHDASLTAGYVDLGGRLVRNDVDVELAAPGARTEIFGVLLAADGSHVDDHIRVDHAAPATRSHEFFRGIIGHRGRGVFNGKVVVRPGAQKIDAQQSNDNLLLSDQAEIDTKPELEIYADDVKCSHGSTVGELDPEHLFYMRARGIDENDARALLTVAFAATALERIGDAELRAAVAARVNARLAELTGEPR